MGVSTPCFLLLLSTFLACTTCQTFKNNTKKQCPATLNVKCKDGVVLPAWLTPGNIVGEDWVAVKAFVYFMCMIELFLGISIISDRFMTAIEVITSNEKEIVLHEDATGKKQIVMVKIWNETVANLSLMALGSSAPEILLSVIEIIGRGFVAGELGPATVVGSAAFNLFMITAVCVSVLPNGEVRRIKHLNVFAFTASCSVLAYVWMYIILAVSSPGVIHIWEGVITLICFPAMVAISYCIDTKKNPYKDFRKRAHKLHSTLSSRSDIVKRKAGDIEENGVEGSSQIPEKVELLAFSEENENIDAHMREKKRLLVEAYHRVREKYPNVSPENLQELVQEENRKMVPKSRAYYRIQAVRTHTGQGPVFKKQDTEAILQKIEEEKKEEGHEEGVFFNPVEYTVVESCGTVLLTVVRAGSSIADTVEVDYETMDGSASAGEDYVESKGTLVFSPGDVVKTITIKINDDDVFELDEHFYCKLTLARSNNKERPVHIGETHTAKITILDDDYPGVFTLENGKYEIMESIGVLTVRVLRKFGARGKIRIPWRTEEMSAKGFGEDFDEGEGVIEFLNEEFVKTIDIYIVDREQYDKHKTFKIILGEPELMQPDGVPSESEATLVVPPPESNRLSKIIQAGMAALGEYKETEVHIVECREFRDTIDSMLRKKNTASFWKSSSWAGQFQEAFQIEGGDDEDEGDEESGEFVPSYFDFFMHYLSLPWKVLFALVPPTDILDGWACFWVAIGMIGLLTAVTGDIASHFGCTIGLADSVVAITFVALGTSLPDTFASKTATINDETADSSIGNITGSNSVNVFLGIGLAWSVAAFYHTINGGEFKIDPGTLGFSVLIFCIEALFCIGFLMFRRFYSGIGAELGGPRHWNMITSFILACFWFIYILLSSLQTYCHIETSF